MPLQLMQLPKILPTLIYSPKTSSLNGKSTPYFDQAAAILANNKGKTIPATVLRDQKTENITLNVSKDGKLGVQPGGLSLESLEKLGYYKVSTIDYSLMEAIPVGLTKGKDQLVGYGKQLK
jgi:regulator of sigma E protease